MLFRSSHLVLSEAALLLLLVVDSESELERGRLLSFLYTRKLSVTGWFPPSKPFLGRPGTEKERVLMIDSLIGKQPRYTALL